MAGIACVRGVLGEAADALTDDEIQTTLDDLQRRARRRQTREPLDNLERAIFNEAEDVAKDLELAGMIERRNALLNETIHARLIDFAESFNEADPSMGLEARLVGVNFARQGGRLSVHARSQALEARLLSEMVGKLREAGHLEAITARSGGIQAWLRGEGEGPLDREIARELWAIGREVDGVPIERAPASSPVRQIAEIIHTYQEAARQLQNRAGAHIRNLPGYIVRQSHDQAKIRRAGRDAWIAEVLPRLDAERTFDGADPQDFLRSTWDALSSGVHIRTAADAPLIGFKGPANLAKKASQERVLHFRSADDWFDYNQRFGAGSLMNAVLFGLRRAAQDTALMETFGPNPRAMFDRVRRDLREKHRTDTDKLNRLNRPQLDHQFANVDGTVDMAGNPSAAQGWSLWRALQATARLGGVMLSAIGDVPLMASEVRYQGRGLLSGYQLALDNMMRGRGSGERRRLADGLGVGLDGMLGSIHARFSSEDSLPGTSSRLMQLFFRATGLTWWTDAHKTGAGLMISRDLAIDAPLTWAELPMERQRLLRLYEIDEQQWDLLRTNAITDAEDGRQYMMPDLIRGIVDEQLPEGAPRARQRTRDELETRLRALIADRVDYAVLTPGARERAALNRGFRAGTLEGEGLRLFTQFKSFPLTVLSKVYGRELQARGVGSGRLRDSFVDMLRHGRGDLLGLVHIILATTLFGYASMTLKDWAKGRTHRDPEDGATWAAAMMQGGGLGIMGDFMFGEFNRFGGSLYSTIGGPTAGSAEDLARMWSDFIGGDLRGSSVSRFATSHTPFINLFYTRMALDYLLLHQIQEMLSPGALRRMEQRVQEQNSQTFLFPPSQAIPRGGGDRLFEELDEAGLGVSIRHCSRKYSR